MYSIKKYCYVFSLILLCLTGFSLAINAQAIDSLVISRKILHSGDLILHTDSFKTKVVAVSRSAKNVEDLPVTIYVITHEDIIKNHYVTLVDVLKSLPGIRVSQPGNGELGEIFMLRDLAGNYYTKILLDGMYLKPTVVSGMPIGAQLPIRQAERIEVVYGPSASLYGADAASGVINIITKEAEKGTFARADVLFGQNEYSFMNFMIGGKAGKNKNLLQYNFYGSKADFNNINIRYNRQVYYNPLEHYQRKGIKFNIGGTEYAPLDINEDLLKHNGIQPSAFMESNNYPLHYAGTLTQPDMEAELSSGSYMVGINLKFRGVGFSYNNMYRRTHSSIGKSPFFYRYNDPLTYWGERIQRITLSYDKPIGKKLTTTTNLSNLIYRMDNNSSLALTFMPNADKVYLYSASDDFLYEQILTYTPTLNLEIVGGWSYQISSNLPKTNYMMEPFPRNTYVPYGVTNFPADSLLEGFGDHTFSFHNWSVFAQGYWVVHNFRLIGGVRYDINSLYGNSLNPRVALMYRFPKTTFRLSAGTAIKAPPSSVTYESLAYPTETVPDSIHYLVVPNSKLKPENFTAYEFSLNHKLFRRIDVELSVYYNKVSNLINLNAKIPADTLRLSVSDSVSTKTNDQEAKSILFGGQLRLRLNDIISKIKLNAEISFTYIADQSKNFSIVNQINNVFNLTPKHYGQCRLSASPAKNLYLQFDNTWMTQWMRLFTQKDLFKNVEGYYTIDFLVNYNFGSNLQAFVKVYNLLNEPYATPNVTKSDMDMISIPQPGRNIRFGFGFTYTFN